MISVALTNLGKYNEGTLDYVWLDLPATDEDIAEAFKTIGVADGTEYEEHFLSDWDAPDFFEVGQYSSVTKLNELAAKLAEIDGLESIFDGTYEAGDIVNLAHELEAQGHIQDAHDYVGDIVSDEELDEMVRHEAESGGWQRVAHFLDGIKYMSEDYYYINGYANAENLSQVTLDAIVDDMMNEIKRNLEV